MSNPLFGRLKPSQRAAVDMMFNPWSTQPAKTRAFTADPETAEDPAFLAKAMERRRSRMDRIDSLPAEIRACVHEYGLTVVDACMQLGVTKARHIHHLVATIRGGSVDGKVPFFEHRVRDEEKFVATGRSAA